MKGICIRNRAITKTRENRKKRNDKIKIKKLFKLLENNEERQKLFIECANDVMWEWDIKSNDIVFSDKIKDYSVKGLSSAAYINFDEYVDELINEEDRIKFKKDIKNHLESKNDFFSSEYRILLKNGNYKWVSNRAKATRDISGKPVRMIGTINDLSEMKYCEADIRWMGYHDLLTGLSNKKMFLKELQKTLQERKSGSVIFIHIDGFKNINYIYGHDFADKLIINISDSLEALAGGGNLLSRIAGDEFLILLRDTHETCDIEKICKSVTSLFENQFIIEDKSVYVDFCIGISVFPKESREVDILLKNAYIAMYRSKLSGKNRYSFFDEKMTGKIIRRVEIEECLRNADFDDEFEIYYQPQMDIKDKKMIGMEALLRWTNKRLGKVSPAEFIPIAEDIGIICGIGEWVIRKVCRQCSYWDKKGYDFGKVSINISCVQLRDHQIFDMVKNIISETGIKPYYLSFEITESAVLEDFNHNIKILDAFIDLGINIALDDYGTGYSSINYLRKLPLNTLKIDKSFVDNIKNSYTDRTVIKGLIAMAKSLNLSVIVEGVEYQEQVDILYQIGCKIIQGYFFSKPINSVEIESLLKLSLPAVGICQ